MKRIKIKDLPREAKVSKEEMKKILGGIIIIDSMPGGMIGIKTMEPGDKRDPLLYKTGA